MLVLDHLQNLTDGDEPLNAMPALFLTHCVRAAAAPEDPMYPAILRHLLQRPMLESHDVPLLYALLYSASDNATQDRNWLLRFIRDSIQSSSVSSLS